MYAAAGGITLLGLVVGGRKGVDERLK
jgi:hypothetical protein